MGRRPSRFAFVGRAAEPKTGEGPLDLSDPRLESAVASLQGEKAGLDENDPRQMARLMRRFSEAIGIKVPGMEEAARRLESGEDPEKVEGDMDSLFAGEEEPSEDKLQSEGGANPVGDRWKSLSRRLGPSAQD